MNNLAQLIDIQLLRYVTWWESKFLLKNTAKTKFR